MKAFPPAFISVCKFCVCVCVCVCICWGLELCEVSPSWLLFSSNPCFWDNPANNFWGSVPDVSRASVSFGASFSLESLLSFESPKPMSVGTQAKLIILVTCLAKQVRPEWIVNKMVILLSLSVHKGALEMSMYLKVNIRASRGRVYFAAPAECCSMHWISAVGSHPV